MSNDLTQRLAKIWGALDPVDEWREDISDAIDALTAQAAEIEALAAPVQEPNPWREAVIDRLAVLWNLTQDNENDPHKALADIERMVEMMALDPCISSEAQALIDRGRAEATPPRAARRMRSVTYVCPVCAASLERQE